MVRSRTFVTTALVVLTLGSAAIFARSSEDRASDPVVRGARIHADLCAACHGTEGRGDGPGAVELKPPARDFTSGRFRFRTTESGSPPRLSDIENVLRVGRSGTAMPAFVRLLSKNQIADVAAFVLSLRPRGLSGREVESFVLPEFPPRTPEHLAEGRALYLTVGCWKCHGTDGSGRGPSAKELETDEGGRIRPRDFRYEPFRGGATFGTIAHAILSGLIGTPMPSHAEVLVVPRASIDAVLESLPPEVRHEVGDFERAAPSAEEVATLEDDAWLRLRDRHLVSLAHYVLSLSRRDRLSYRLFREDVERGARTP